MIRTRCATIQAIDTESGIFLGQLTRLNFRYRIHRRKARVFCERHGYALQSFGEGTEGILFQSADFISLSGTCQRAGYLRCASAVQDLVVLYYIANGTQGIVY